MLHQHPFHTHGGAMARRTQQSGLTTDASASCNKRRRDHEQQQPMLAGEAVSAAQSSLLGSMGASASGRPTLACHVASLFSQHNAQLDALVRLQSERLGKLLEEAAKKQQRRLLAAAEERISKRLRIKEAELIQAAKKNVELEERVRQTAAESQYWLAVARSSEALACSLRATLEQTLQQQRQQELGFRNNRAGSSDSDAQSCCFENGERQQRSGAGDDCRWSCRSCGRGNVCVLLLPCRHLCLCTYCEPKQELCPVCNAPKNASLRVVMNH